jgi:hypothetical protein
LAVAPELEELGGQELDQYLDDSFCWLEVILKDFLIV